jgi:tetratricopeptide (TPR) repeat protein
MGTASKQTQLKKVTVSATLARARSHVKKGQFTEARQLYHSILDIFPQNQQAKKELKALQKGKGNNKNQLEPPQAKINSLIALYAQGKIQEALKTSDVLTKDYPNESLLYNISGACYQALGQLETAVKYYEQALVLKPGNAEAHCNLGVTLKELGQLEAAVKHYEQALVTKPNYAEAHCNLGVTLKEHGQPEAAVKHYEQALVIKPDYAEAHYNFGNTLKELGQLEIAVKHYEQALAIKPNYAEAKWNLSLTQLVTGNFKAGWLNYENRWKKKDFDPERHYPHPRWDGSSLIGKTLFLYPEQGIGDEIMFSSCIPDLIAQQPKLLIIECDARLKALFNRSFPQVIIQDKNKQKDHVYSLENENIDFHVPMGDLPKYLRPNINAFPTTSAFIKPNIELHNKWVSRFNDIGTEIKIGLSWRGGSKAFEKKTRSTTLQLWEPILQSGAHFVNLQYGDCSHEINQIHKATGITIHDWPDADPLKNLDNFSAQIAALDLVITIDNSTAHFAGALGVPTWVLLPFNPDWRWLLNRDDSPWYPSIRLFRQKESGNWTPVFNEVHQALKEYPIIKTRTVNLSATVLATARVFREGDITKGHTRLTELLGLLGSESVKLSQDQVLALKPFLNDALTCLKDKDYSSLADILENDLAPLLESL